MTELFKRLKSETPKFFKKMRNVGLSLAGLGYGIPLIPHFPVKYVSMGEQFIWVGLTIALVAQTAVQKPEDLKK